MLRRIVALVFIFICTSIAWLILGTTIFSRTYSHGPGLRDKVESSWGAPQKQSPPKVTYSYLAPANIGSADVKQPDKAPERLVVVALPLEGSHVDVDLHLDHRQKGLLWYSTYVADFSGSYSFTNDTGEDRTVTLTWPFPAEKAIYDNLAFSLDGQPLAFRNNNAEATAVVTIASGARRTLKIGYRTQGMDSWEYDFGSGVSQVRDFSLRMRTNFRQVDFPENAVSPTSKHPTSDGWELEWQYRNLVSGYDLAVTMPAKLQPGPLAGEISYFAPVSLFFFFFIVFILATLRELDLHPMNYFFLAAAFFSFHLLLAYLVDHIAVHLAFAICSVVSIALVVSYLRLVTGVQFALQFAGLAQLIYLVLFSYAFFFNGFTGLAITVGAIVTLFVVMQGTGRVNWSRQFQNVTSPAQP